MMKYLHTLSTILCLFFLTACKTAEPPIPYTSESDVMSSEIWNTQAILDLGMDLRCDGVSDFKADCTGSGVSERLSTLRSIPATKLIELQNAALALRWDGQ